GGSGARSRPVRARGHAEPSAGSRPARALRIGGEPPGLHEALQPDHDPRRHVSRSPGRTRHSPGIRVRAGRGGPGGLARFTADGPAAVGRGAGSVRAAGPRCVFFSTHQPLILNAPGEIDGALTLELVRQQRILITSGHPMGGCALGGDARRDVVDSRGRSWDVDGLYVADSSILPTSLGVNPCYTVYALGRYIAEKMIEEIRAQ